MKKLTLRIFTILTISIMLTLLIVDNKVNATNFTDDEVKQLDLKDNIKIASNEKILKYDATTDTTTEVNIEELKKELRINANLRTTNNSLTLEGYNPSGITVNVFNQMNTLSLIDNLQRVSDVNVFPYNTICRVNHVGGGGSGVLVGKNILITAAHVVYDDNNNPYANWVAQAGFNTNHSLADSGWSQVYYYENWMSNHSWQYDIAICVLNENIGEQVGFMGFQYLGDSILSNLPGVTAVGYPEERDASMHQYYSKGNVKSTANSYFTTDCYTSKGMSGGPMINDETGFVLGVVQGTDVFSTSQRTSRITSDLFSLLSSLRS